MKRIRRREPRRHHRAARFALLAIAAACGLAISACSGPGNSAGPTSQPGSHSVLDIGWATPPNDLDPAKDGLVDIAWRSLADAYLIHVNQNGTYSPGLATSWGYVGTGNTTFSLTLRHNVKFSDGEPLTAAAVKGWLEYFEGIKGITWSTIGAIKSIDTQGEYTVTIHLAAPNPTLPLALSEESNWGAVQCPKFVASPALLGTQTCGAGPYTLDAAQTVTNEQYTYVPDKQYYDQSAIKYQKVVVKIISTPSAMLNALTTGQIQFAQGDLPTANAATSAGFNVLALGSNPAGLLLASRSGPLASLQVRQALNYAVNRQAIAAGLFGKYGTPSSEIPTTDGWVPSLQKYYSYDPGKAKELLAAAGYPNGFPLSGLVYGVGGGAAGAPVVQAVAQSLAAVGVKVSVADPATAPEFVAARASQKYPLIGMTAPYGSTYDTVAVLFRPGSPLNPFNLDDPQISALWAHGSAAADPSASWQELNKYLVAQAYALPVLSYPATYFYSKSLGNVGADGAARSFPLAAEWQPA
jgi:peptide/nickel transport system substrate-binding protein